VDFGKSGNGDEVIAATVFGAIYNSLPWCSKLQTNLQMAVLQWQILHVSSYTNKVSSKINYQKKYLDMSDYKYFKEVCDHKFN
jgi:hypoxanthine-guanine phosphoribosyltransferase